MKFALLAIVALVSSTGCSKNKDEDIVKDMDVYYVLKDSFLGVQNKSRVLINIPIENNVAFNTGDKLILCLRKEGGIINFSHIFNGQKNDNEFYLRATVIGMFKNNEVSLEPYFSPINIKKDLPESLEYKKGRTIILSVRLKPDKNKYLEFIDAKFKDIKYEEAVRIK